MDERFDSSSVGAGVTLDGLFRGTIYNVGLRDANRGRWNLLLCHWSNLSAGLDSTRAQCKITGHLINRHTIQLCRYLPLARRTDH
ncbi:unnamed protein product [Danaus chrysippus]|uniref:(African queen) hypothetical protein n=1 Tax=Danaus chrysippus TaxID=151541 RepID=A0A8J2QPR8_9NEOP|nr:unnamed protein product [Danaus chrysippus]